MFMVKKIRKKNANATGITLFEHQPQEQISASRVHVHASAQDGQPFDILGDVCP